MATVTICRHCRLANLLVVAPSVRVQILGLAQKLNRRFWRLNSWRTYIHKSWNTLYPEIIRTAQYVLNAGLLDCLVAGVAENPNAEVSVFLTPQQNRTL